MKDIWGKNKMGAWQCKLGSLDKAIVLVRSGYPSISNLNVEFHWRISMGSFLPFSDDQYKKEFTNLEECAKYAESIVLDWLRSLVSPIEFEKLKIS